jgi:hypothetical protein
MPNNEQDTLALVRVLLRPPIAYHRAFAEIAGDALAGLFLSQAWYWSQTDAARKRDGWFFKTAEEWEAETGLTRRNQETARKLLKAAGFLEDERRGIPPRVWYRLDVLRIAKALSNLAESAKLIRRKTPKQNGAIRPHDLALFAKSSYQTETTAKTTGSSMPPPPSRFDHATRLAFVNATKSKKTNPAGLARHLANGEDDAQIDAWLKANAETEQQRAKAASAMINERSSEDFQALLEETRQRVESGSAFDWERELLNSHTERNPA